MYVNHTHKYRQSNRERKKGTKEKVNKDRQNAWKNHSKVLHNK